MKNLGCLLSRLDAYMVFDGLFHATNGLFDHPLVDGFDSLSSLRTLKDTEASVQL
jgi:hypothetical protein